MIDLRGHILDGTPCGPTSFAESLEICRSAAESGVRTIVATPHWEAGSIEPPLPFGECHCKLERLEAEMRGAISFRLGFAFQFSEDLPSLVERYGSNLALGGKRHLLVSLPAVEIPNSVEKTWMKLASVGFSIVLAHPECNAVLRRDTPRLARWVSEGITLQIDGASVTGAHGREVKRFAIECLRRHGSHSVVASNTRPGGDRKNGLAHARKVLISALGTSRTRLIINETPSALISDGGWHNNARRPSSRGLASLFRSIGPLKALMGE
jgi:protein-tyrosine phosphatase